MRETWALNVKGDFKMASIEEYRAKLEEFYQSDYAQMTVKELLTGTSNIALPTMVQAKAIIVLNNFIDARELCMRAAVPKGSGKNNNNRLPGMPGSTEIHATYRYLASFRSA